MFEFDGKLLHFGDGMVDLSLKINPRLYKTITPDEYVVVWIQSMNSPFGPMYEKLSWAEGEEVMVDGNIPWRKDKLMEPCALEKFKSSYKRALVYF